MLNYQLYPDREIQKQMESLLPNQKQQMKNRYKHTNSINMDVNSPSTANVNPIIQIINYINLFKKKHNLNRPLYVIVTF